MMKSKIRRSVFVPVAVGLLLLTAIITASLHWYQSQHLEETVSNHLAMVTKVFENQMQSDADVLTGLIEFLKNEPSLQKAYTSGDRNELLKVALPIFREIKAKHRVTHFYFCDVNRVCFLRVHDATRHGDVIDRYTALAAAKTGNPSRGIELGALGSSTLRVVHPWKVGNRLIGYIELGEEIAHLLPRIKTMTGVQLIVTVNKDFLDKSKWEDGLKMLKRQSSWTRYDNFVVVDSTLPLTSSSIDAMLCIPHSVHDRRIFGAKLDNTLYRGGLLPLIDAGGRDVGELVALVDVSRDANALKKTLLTVVVATVILFALISWLFWTYLGRLERSLAAVTEDLRLAGYIAEETAVRLGKLSRAVEQSPAGIVIMNWRGAIEYANPGFSEMTGYRPDDFSGMDSRDLEFNVHPPEFHENIRDTVMRGDTWRGEICVRKKDGKTLWCSTTISPIIDKKNTVANCVAVMIDITSQKQASEELLEYAGSLAKASAEIKKQAKELTVSELKYRTLFDASRDAIMILEPYGAYLDANPASAKLFGLKDGREFTGYSPSDLSPECQPDGTPSSVRAEVVTATTLANGSHFFEWTHQRRNGSVFPATVLLTRMEIEGKTILQATVRDTTAEKQAAEALRVAKEGAEAANQAKSAFLASMSHELRTPLHGVVGMTELLKGTPLEERQRQFVDACHTSGKSLIELINDVLDFSRIEAGKFDLDVRNFKLGQMVTEAVDAMRFQAEQKGLLLVADVAPQTDRSVQGDDARLRQVLLNLIGNAVKFSDSGEIVVRVEPAKPEEGEHAIRFEVADNGIGIAADKIDRLFLSFSQADPSIARKYGGTGLGLAISKRLIELMGGTVGVTSRLGQGSTFWFVVPLPPSGQESQQNDPSPEAGERFQRELQAILKGRKVLLVEDNRINRMFAQEIVQQAGMKCRTVETGLQAIEAVRHDRFDVVLMDCHMPEMDGFKTTRHIRDMEREGQIIRHTPIVALTANAIKGDREHCLECGMDDYIAKPFGSQELLRVIGRLLMPDWKRTVEKPAETPPQPVPPLLDGQTPIDRNTLLMRCRGNVEFAQSLLSDFEVDLPQRVDRIVSDLRQSDAAAAIESAHTLKGAAGTMSAEPLQTLAAEIEEATKSGNLADASVGVDRLRDEAQRCLHFIPKLREQIGNSRKPSNRNNAV
jgi:PAS domain S-box-containing protein